MIENDVTTNDVEISRLEWAVVEAAVAWRTQHEIRPASTSEIRAAVDVLIAARKTAEKDSDQLCP